MRAFFYRIAFGLAFASVGALQVHLFGPHQHHTPSPAQQQSSSISDQCDLCQALAHINVDTSFVFSPIFEVVSLIVPTRVDFAVLSCLNPDSRGPPLA